MANDLGGDPLGQENSNSANEGNCFDEEDYNNQMHHGNGGPGGLRDIDGMEDDEEMMLEEEEFDNYGPGARGRFARSRMGMAGRGVRGQSL